MKFSAFFVLMITLTVPVLAYQAGPATPAKFGSGQQAAGQNNYRTFSNYNDRVQTRGVQTDAVQTQLAGNDAKDLAAEKKRNSKKAAPAAQQQQPQTNKPAPAASQQPAATSAAADPAAGVPAEIMQQVQGMVNSVGSLSGALQQQGAKGQNPAGMPDVSALMGGGAAMPAAPAKK